MGDYFYLNGEILPAAQCYLRITDLALLRGFGIFDFFRTHGRVPYLMEKYLERFTNSAGYLGLEVPHSKKELAEIILDLLNKNNIYEAGIRLVLTGGYTENGYTPGNPNFFILIEKINFPDPEKFEHGVKLQFHEHQRELSHIKSINYLTPISLRGKINAENAYDVLYHFNNRVLEVSRSNFFIVKGNSVITADKDILMGITRGTVINIAKNYFNVEERPIAPQEIWTADEAFMTGTTKKVLPVVNIDNRLIGNGKAGKVTKKLQSLFYDFENSQPR